LEWQLKKSEYLVGEYSIADIATYPWIMRYFNFGVSLDDFPAVKRWTDRIGAARGATRHRSIETPELGSCVNKAKLLKAVSLLEKGDWRAAHEIVQQDEESPLACWAHGIVHLREGDLPNARYWYREAKRALPDAASVPGEITALKKSLR
jgi:hypothetical protein